MKTKKLKIRKLKLNEALTIMKLHDLDIRTIHVSFSGGGDDGGISDVECETTEGNYIGSPGSDMLEDLFYDTINGCTDLEGDWVNNNGGYGTLMIDLEKQVYTVECSFNTTRDYCWDNEPFISESKY